MRKGEEQRGFVGVGRIGEFRGAAFVGEQKEACEVVLVGFDAPPEDFESVEAGGVGAADGRRACEASFGDFARAACGVVPLDDLHAGAGFQEIAALHQGDRVRADFRDVVGRLPGESRQDVRDAEFLFADDPGVALLQEFVVGQQAAGDGVFDGRDAQQRRIGGHTGEQLVETQAGQHLYFPVCEVAARRRFVIASRDALYCDLFHNGLKKKIPLNRAGFSCHINLYYLYTVNCMRSRFFPCYKRKSNKNSMQNRMLSSSDSFYRRQM